MPRSFPVCVEPLEQRVLCARLDTIIDSGWKFIRSSPAGAATVAFDDSSWSSINLPHTFNSSDGQDGGNNYFRGGTWYRKHQTLDAKLTGQRVFLKFDGANLVTDLFVNGASVGRHQGGYSAFAFDITPFVNFGADNVFAVKVDNYGNPDVPPRTGDYTFFGGIYRDVHLITVPAVHVDLLDLGSPGVFLKQTNVSATSASLGVTTEVRNDNGAGRYVTVTTTVLDALGATVKTLSSKFNVSPGTVRNFVQNTTIANPHLWNGTSDPYLYRVRVNVSDSTGTLDQIDQPLGFRFFKVDAASGFWLNGKPYDLHGVGFHQDRLNKGFATTAADRAEDLKLIKEIGASAVRLAHYAHAQDMFDGLDKAGIVTWAEIPLFENARDTTAFTDNTKLQLRELIKQNYNHPAVFFWGIFNEANDNPVNNALLDQLQKTAKAEDTTRPTTVATDVSFDAASNYKSDLTAYNKYYGWYYGKIPELSKFLDDARANFPDRPIGVSEFGAGGSINQHSDPVIRPSPGSTFHPEEYQNLLNEQTWQILASKKYLWSKFVWSMFDFGADARKEGDTMGRNDKGLVTYDHKTRKDAFYFYKANWSTSSVLYITSRRFTARTNATAQVKVYSNAGGVTLKINGKSYGQVMSADHVFTWNVTLSPGANKIEVSAMRKGVTYTDSVTWTYTTPANATPSSLYSGERVGERGERRPPTISATWLPGAHSPSPLPLSPAYRGEGDGPTDPLLDELA